MQLVIEALRAVDGISVNTMFFILALAALGLAAFSVSESGKKRRR
jgi:hypothetical protein